MTTSPKRAPTAVPALLLVVCAALPAATAAQTTPPPPETPALSISMSEALRSPFHSSPGVVDLAFAGPVPVPGAGDQETPATADDPSFLGVFLPTLAATVVSELLFLYAIICASPDGGDCGSGWGTFLPVVATSAVILAPPATASLAGGSFATALIGSVLGAGVNLAILQVGPEIPIMVPLLPVLHAGLTTSLSLEGL